MAPLHIASTQHRAIVPTPAQKPPTLKKNSTILPLGDKRETRRAFLHGLMIAAAAAGTLQLGPLNAASAASKRRPPAPAPADEEKKDPNLSGVQAKVLASRKRKEAMKESVAKMREKGKPVNN